MDSTKEKKKKLKKNKVADIGELGGEIITSKDDKILEEEGVKEGRGDTKTKKKNKRGSSEGKNTDSEAGLGGEDVASSRKLVEKCDATCSEDYVKVRKKKKDKEGKRERKDEADEHLTVNIDITAKKAERKKKEDKKKGGSGPQLTEHSVEDGGQATENIQNVEIVDRGQELDGVLVEKAERKKKKKDKKRTVIGFQITDQRVEDASSPSGHGLQNTENVETGAALDDCLVVEKVEKGDATCSEDYVKALKKKKDKEGKRERKDEPVENLTVNDDISSKKVDRKKKKDKKKDCSGPQLTEHSVEDGGQATEKIQNVELVDRGQELDGGLVEKAERKKKKKDKKRTGIGYQIPEQRIDDVGLPRGHGLQNSEIVETGDVLDDCLVEKVGKKKRKREKKKIEVGVNLGASEDVTELPSNETQELQNTEIVETGDVLDDCLVEKVGKKKRKREKKKIEVDVNLDASEVVTELPSNVTQELQNTSTKGFETDQTSDKDVTKKSKKKQRTREKEKESNASGSQQVNADSAGNEEGNVRKRKKPDSVAKGDQDAKSVKQKKTVRFSESVEVFPVSDDNEEKLVQGKRFSPEEDEIVKQAVYDYIEAHCLGDEGLNMVLNCRAHREVRNCWKEIASALPHRPRTSVYYRAQTLFRRSESTKWTKEDLEQIKEFQKKHGNQWKILAQDLQKHRVHVKDTWRRIRLSNAKKGHWNQEEYQSLFDLVNLDLKTRYKEEKKSKHGMLRDNICWTAISDKLATRTHAICCQKWYDQLTSTLVAEGEWSDVDDYRLINALYELDASCIEDVDWDNLLEHRDGDVCQKRWSQMALHIGSHTTQPFSEQVEVLSKRYCPDLIDVREEWDNKPYADLVTNTNHKVQPDPESA